MNQAMLQIYRDVLISQGTVEHIPFSLVEFTLITEYDEYETHTCSCEYHFKSHRPDMGTYAQICIENDTRSSNG